MPTTRRWLVQPEFLVERNPERCIQCEACVRQCANDAHEFDDDDQCVYSDSTRCVGCHRCATLCPTNAIAIKQVELEFRPHGNWTAAALRNIYKQAEDGGVLLSGMGNDQPFPVYWDRLLLNASLSAYGLRYGERQTMTIIDEKTLKPTVLSRMEYGDYWALLPGAGLGWQVARHVKLNLEVHVPLADFADVGKVWLVMYGVRAFGRETFFDLSFVLPVYPGLGNIIKYIPLGIPLASVGLQW